MRAPQGRAAHVRRTRSRRPVPEPLHVIIFDLIKGHLFNKTDTLLLINQDMAACARVDPSRRVYLCLSS